MNLSDVKDFYKEGGTFVKILCSLILLCILLITAKFTYDILIGKPVSALGFEINQQPTINDNTKNLGASSTTFKPIRSAIPSKTVKGTIARTVKGNLETNQNSGNNQGNIGGSGNKVQNTIHTINGENNGINGDVNISNEIELIPKDFEAITKYLNTLYKDKPYLKRCFSIASTPGSNSGKIPNQIFQFMKNNNFQFKGTSMLMSEGMVEGLKFDVNNNDSCLLVCLGNF